MFVDRATAALLEAAPAYRAANYARAVRPQPGAPSPAVIAIGGAQVVYAAPDRPVNRAIGLGMTGPANAAPIQLSISAPWPTQPSSTCWQRAAIGLTRP